MSECITSKHARDAAADMRPRELCAARRRLEKMKDRLDIWDQVRLSAYVYEMQIRHAVYKPRVR